MKTIYLFDVDGTLTQPLLEIEDEFAEAFLSWLRTEPHVYLVTGSDIKKTRRQVFAELRNKCKGIFTCSGNELWNKNKLVYRNKFKASPALIEDLELYLEHADYRIRTGNHIEQRPGMLNFSVVGRNANLLQREAYTKWDSRTEERKDIVNYITLNHPHLDGVIGGTISVDIYPKGRDKAQVVPYLRNMYEEEVRFVFVGDRNVPGGNDYALALELDKDPNSEWIQVWSPTETQALIQHSALFIGEAGI